MANPFFQNVGKIYSKRYFPVLLDFNFVVNHTDTGGLGVTSLKGYGVNNVFMNTNQTPGKGSNGITNPNPAAGYIAVQLADNYNKFLFADFTLESANSGSNVAVGGSALTVGQVYVITVVGTTTAAEWATVGVPVGVTAAVGVTFIAAATGAGSGSGQAQVPKTTGSGISHIEVVGNPNQTIAPIGPATGTVGGWIFLQCMKTQSGALTFTGSALGTHTHDLLLKNAAVADGATTRVNAGANLLGANTGSDITVTGSGANGGVVAASAGTPAGTINTPSLTLVAAAPADGTTISIQLGLSNSSLDV